VSVVCSLLFIFRDSNEFSVTGLILLFFDRNVSDLNVWASGYGKGRRCRFEDFYLGSASNGRDLDIAPKAEYRPLLCEQTKLMRFLYSQYTLT
jgi:hypothetical protein